MAPANERQATPAASFDPDGIKKLLLRLFAAFRTLVFFLSNVPPGEARSPERSRGRGQPVHDGEREGWGRGSSCIARSTLLISPTLPPLLDLFTSYLRRLNASRLSASRRLGEAPPVIQHQLSDRRRQPPSVAAGSQGGEAEKKTVKNQYCVF